MTKKQITCIMHNIINFEGVFMKGATFADSTLSTMNDLLVELERLRYENETLKIENILIKNLINEG